MRRAAALAFIPVAVALAVAGCSSSSSSSKPAAAADTYQSVKVTGSFGKAPTVTIPKEKGTGALYTKTLIQGNGAKITSTDGVVGNYVAYDWSGKTSKLLGSSYTQGTPSLFVGGQIIAGVQKALIGQKIGSRVLAVVPPADGLGAQATSEGIGATDTLVFVIDMDSQFGLTSVSGQADEQRRRRAADRGRARQRQHGRPDDQHQHQGHPAEGAAGQDPDQGHGPGH